MWLLRAENPALHSLLTALLAVLLGLQVFMILAIDNPYRGDYSVPPDAFELVLEVWMAEPTAAQPLNVDNNQ
jgi:hypothetical protein